jgi:hypothetical protein
LHAHHDAATGQCNRSLSARVALSYPPAPWTDLSCPPAPSAGTDLSCPPAPSAGTDLSCPWNSQESRTADTINRSLQGKNSYTEFTVR